MGLQTSELIIFLNIKTELLGQQDVVQCLPSIYKAQDSIPSIETTTTTKQNY